MPFFAYGVLKPGEIAYSRIKDLIYEKNEACVNYSMKHRDGVPVLLSKYMDLEETCGYIFHFSDMKLIKLLLIPYPVIYTNGEQSI